MQYTPEFELALPDGTDNVDITVLNANMQKIADILDDIYGQLPTPDSFVIDTSEGIFDSETEIASGSLDYSANIEIGSDYTWSVVKDGTTHTGQVTAIDMSQGQVPGGVAALIVDLGIVVSDKWIIQSPPPVQNNVTNWYMAGQTELPNYTWTFTKVQS